MFLSVQLSMLHTCAVVLRPK